MGLETIVPAYFQSNPTFQLSALRYYLCSIINSHLRFPSAFLSNFSPSGLLQIRYRSLVTDVIIIILMMPMTMMTNIMMMMRIIIIFWLVLMNFVLVCLIQPNETFLNNNCNCRQPLQRMCGLIVSSPMIMHCHLCQQKNICGTVITNDIFSLCILSVRQH